MDRAVRIVLIEDEPADVYWFQHTLREMGLAHEITVFKTGAAALKDLNGIQTPDVIFTDWFLPILNAPEFIADLKTMLASRNVPLYVITGNPDLRTESDGIGAQGCLIKPVDAAQLRAVFDALPQARAAAATIGGPVEASRSATL